MMADLPDLTHAAQRVVEQLGYASWYGGMVVLAAGLGAWMYRSTMPTVSCWCWRVAALKLLLILIWFVPIDLPILPTEQIQPIGRERSGVPVPIVSPKGNLSAIVESVPTSEHPGDVWSVIEVGLLGLFGAWLAGVLVSVATILRQQRAVARLLAQSDPSTDKTIDALVWEQARALKLRSLPRVRIARNSVQSPLLVGVWRPTIVLPAGTEGSFSNSQRRMMISHELMHLARRDLAWNLLLMAAKTIFFFHPLVWWLDRRWVQDQELACDEGLIRGGMVRPAAYGELLLDCALRWGNEKSISATMAPAFGVRSDLERRVFAMSRFIQRPRRLARWGAGVVLLSAVVALVPWRLTAQEQDPVAQPEGKGATGVPDQVAADARDEKRESMRKIRRLAEAMVFYADKNDSLPAASLSREGKPLLSWRVAILPYLDQEELFGEFHLNEPWDSPHNKKLVAKMPDVFASPAMHGQPKDGRTVYLTPRAEFTAFPGTEALRLKQVTDGVSDTIAVVEVDPAAAVYWTKPDDWTITSGKLTQKLNTSYQRSNEEKGFMASFLDAHGECLPADVPENKLRGLLTIAGGELRN